MDQAELRSYLERLIDSLDFGDREMLQARLESLASVFPFNEYEYIITFMVDRSVISFLEYEVLRDNYVSANRYLDLFSLAPRTFGQGWGESHLLDLDARFQKADKNLDPEYEGQYDLWFEGIRVEVKTARAIDNSRSGAMASRALHWGTEAPFWMNFQQMKLDIGDVFVFIGVWVDKIVYWVLSNEEVKQNEFLSHQHRGGVEYQIGIRNTNIQEFDVFRVEAAELTHAINMKARIQ